MNAILTQLLQDLTRHEGLALLVSALLTSAGIVCVAAAASVVLRHRSARARSLAWRAALLALLAAGVWKLMPEVPPPVVVEWQVPETRVKEDIPVAALAELRHISLPHESGWDRFCTSCDSWSVRLWLAVAAGWMLWRVSSVVLGLRALLRRSDDAPERVRQLGSSAGLPENTRCRMVEELGSPMLTGWSRPVIWLPSAAAGWDEARLQMVLRHEAAHWQRKDWLWQWLAQAAVCLWWWQPLAWQALRQMRIEAEHAADDLAVAGSEQAPDYARALVEIAAGLPAVQRNSLGVTMLGSDGLKRRVHALLRMNRWRGRIGLGALSALAVVTLVLGILVATSVEFAPQKPVYRSIAKVVAGGSHLQGGNWQAQAEDFYGTIVETLESSEMKRRALDRVQALQPKLKTGEVQIRVERHKNSAIFSILATGEDPKFTRAFLDALLDEFIAFRQSIREVAQGRVVTPLLAETAAKQKAMEEKNAALTSFAQENNILVNNNDNNRLAQSLSALRAQRGQINAQIAEIKLALSAMNEEAKTEIRTLTSSVPARPLSQMEEVYLKTKSELFVLNNERSFLLKERKPDEIEVVELDRKIAKAGHLLASAAEQIREEMSATVTALERKIALVTAQIEEQEAQALSAGAKIARHEQLKTEATAAKQAYEKMATQVQSISASFDLQSDFVAIQERASAAAAYAPDTGLLPLWKLWKSGTPTKQASAP